MKFTVFEKKTVNFNMIIGNKMFTTRTYVATAIICGFKVKSNVL